MTGPGQDEDQYWPGSCDFEAPKLVAVVEPPKQFLPVARYHHYIAPTEPYRSSLVRYSGPVHIPATPENVNQ